MEYSKKFSAKVISVYANNKMIIDALTENSFWLGRYLCVIGYFADRSISTDNSHLFLCDNSNSPLSKSLITFLQSLSFE